jgi:hypothetical protein
VSSFIDPALIRAIIAQESRGNPGAVNPESGAAGLMQIMPETARDPGYGVRPMPWNKRFDPEENERFGTEYFDAMMRHYNGDTTRALAAYNWGPGNTDKWNGDMAALPAETQNYIHNISQSAGLGQGAKSSGTQAPPPAVDKQKAGPRQQAGLNAGQQQAGLANSERRRQQAIAGISGLPAPEEGDIMHLEPNQPTPEGYLRTGSTTAVSSGYAGGAIMQFGQQMLQNNSKPRPPARVVQF